MHSLTPVRRLASNRSESSNPIPSRDIGAIRAITRLSPQPSSRHSFLPSTATTAAAVGVAASVLGMSSPQAPSSQPPKCVDDDEHVRPDRHHHGHMGLSRTPERQDAISEYANHLRRGYPSQSAVCPMEPIAGAGTSSAATPLSCLGTTLYSFGTPQRLRATSNWGKNIDAKPPPQRHRQGGRTPTETPATSWIGDSG